MHGRNRHRLRVLVAVVAAALVVVPLTSAGNPDVEHFTFGPFVTTYQDFCGTGEAVVETFSARLTVWNDSNQPLELRNHSVGEDVFTSLSTGVTVVTRAAYSFTDALVSGDPSGINTHEWRFKGAAQITRIVGGGVIASDAGLLVVQTTWLGPEFESEPLDVRVLEDAGGHPSFGGDVCAVMVRALGLG